MKHMAEMGYKKNKSSLIWLTESLLLFLFFILASCHKENAVNDIDPQYPTTIKPLDSQDYQTRLDAYWLRNPFIFSDLNPYGYCNEHAQFRDLPYPPIYKEISAAEAIKIAKKFIAANQDETGVKDTSLLVFSVGDQFPVGDSYFVTYLQIQTQVVDSMDIQYAQIIIRLENDQVVECHNNWFPDVYIPLRFLISPDEAVSNLVGQDYSLPTLAGETSGKVTEAALAGATISKEIIQYLGPYADRNSSSNLELRIVYKIFLPSAYTIFYVDVMTGKTLGSEATIFSK
jgi:hypothetical protein